MACLRKIPACKILMQMQEHGWLNCEIYYPVAAKVLFENSTWLIIWNRAIIVMQIWA